MYTHTHTHTHTHIYILVYIRIYVMYVCLYTYDGYKHLAVVPSNDEPVYWQV